jgi:lysophospholipase L1-like esterase
LRFSRLLSILALLLTTACGGKTPSGPSAIPKLSGTIFLALGDSLTEGKHKLIGHGIVVIPSDPNINPGIYNEPGSYPEALSAALTARYKNQNITVYAFGRGGELAGDAYTRLHDFWNDFVPPPNAVLVLDGTNDLTDGTAATSAGMQAAIDDVIKWLRSDIEFAKSKGTKVFLGTLPPMIAPERADAVAAVPVLNAQIRALAVEQNVTLVDLNSAVNPSMIGTTDGIHPYPGSPAYPTMADAWMKAISATMEVK